MLSISVVIPNYNGERLLEKNLPKIIEALKFANVDYEIIIVDDCSQDNSVLFVKENFPDVRILQNKENSGFSYSVNRGIEIASKDLVFIVNNDIELAEDYFVYQLEHFKDKNVFGVMGKILATDKKTVYDTAKYPYCRFAKIKGTKNYISLSNENESLPTFMLSGANALIDRKKLQVLAGFDTIYSPFYWEDTDLGVRAWRLGWRLVYEPKSVCYHPLSATINKFFKNDFKKTITERNKNIFHLIHLPAFQRFFYWLKLFFKLPVSFFGKKYVFKAFVMTIAKINEIRYSRAKFEELQKKYGGYGIFDVCKKIKNMLVNKKIQILHKR